MDGVEFRYRTSTRDFSGHISPPKNVYNYFDKRKDGDDAMEDVTLWRDKLPKHVETVRAPAPFIRHRYVYNKVIEGDWRVDVVLGIGDYICDDTENIEEGSEIPP